MLVVETIARIRREYFVKGKPIKEIVRDVKVSRNTVRKVIRSQAYGVHLRPAGPADAEAGAVDGRAGADPGGQRDQVEAGAADAATDLRSPRRVWAMAAATTAVRRYAKAWRWRRSASTAQTYVPLVFSPGEAYQFDWSHEYVVLAGVTTMVKVAHVRLCHSRMFFVLRLSAREPGDGVRRPRPGIPAVPGCLPARHLRQHEDGGADRPHRQGVCAFNSALRADVWPLPGRTDSMHAGRTGVGEGCRSRTQVGIDPRSVLHPAAALQDLRRAGQRLALGPVRRLRPASSPPGVQGQDCLAGASRTSVRPWSAHRGPFDGFHAVPASVSKTCLVRFDSNKYSVAARAVGRPVEVHAYADRIVIRQDGEIVAEHARRFGRDQTVYDPWHYVPVLAAGSPVRFVTARRSRTGRCPAGPGSRARPARRPRRSATGRWSRSSPPCWRMGWRRWRPPVPRRSLAACAAPASCSTSSIVGASRPRRRRSRRPRTCVFALSRWPIATRYDRSFLRGVGHGAP